MGILMRWSWFILLAPLTISVHAASPVLQLVLPDKQVVNLDEAALAALPQTEFKTATPWTQGTHRYRGPLLTDVLARHGAAGANMLFVTALNGYQQSVDLSLFAGVPLILARYQDGLALTRRNKGPLWLLMPLSAYPGLDISAIHNDMVWQLIRIEVIN